MKIVSTFSFLLLSGFILVGSSQLDYGWMKSQEKDQLLRQFCDQENHRIINQHFYTG